jgi:PhzF family phenazine biosynthesis protein
MRIPIYQLDAFTTRCFAGNPAAVMPLDSFLSDELLQSIAAENNLSETAFLVAEGADYRIRWFTPGTEVPLCGHATLASAAVVFERLEPARTEVTFHSASGPLRVRRSAVGYVLNFPARPSQAAPAPEGLAEALGATPVEVFTNPFNLLAVLNSAEAVRNLHPDIAALVPMHANGVIVTAPGDLNYDFVSRYFTPQKGIAEDPVTGAAHCMLAPCWAERLGKSEFRAYQASRRGGELLVRMLGDRVELEGSCVFFFEGHAEV